MTKKEILKKLNRLELLHRYITTAHHDREGDVLLTARARKAFDRLQRYEPEFDLILLDLQAWAAEQERKR